MSDTLLPCPFCGSSASDVTPWHSGSAVTCDNDDCGAEVSSDGSDAAEHWNARAAAPSAPLPVGEDRAVDAAWTPEIELETAKAAALNYSNLYEAKCAEVRCAICRAERAEKERDGETLRADSAERACELHAEWLAAAQGEAGRMREALAQVVAKYEGDTAVSLREFQIQLCDFNEVQDDVAAMADIARAAIAGEGAISPADRDRALAQTNFARDGLDGP